jgi:hypothetical protein
MTQAINENIFGIGGFFHILLTCCWVAVHTHIMIFYLLFTLRCRPAEFVVSISLLGSLTPQKTIARDDVTGQKFLLFLLLPAINYPQCRCYCNKLITSVMESMKIWNKA